MGLFDLLKKKIKKEPQATIEKEPIRPTAQKAEIPVRRGTVTAKQIELDSEYVNRVRDCFIAFDVETTGLSPFSDRIVEIGAVVFSGGKVDRTFTTLVNPARAIPPAASAVNHITDAMLATAPSERDIYPKFVEFLGEALQGNIVMCAHNAKFDFDFLSNTLSRLGFDANIHYADTLAMARKHISGLENYKQGTIEAYYGLSNTAAHRAVSDAENCGHIFNHLLTPAEISIEAEKRRVEQTTPGEQELEVCAYVRHIIGNQGGDTSTVRFVKNSSGYVDASYLYGFLKFKFSKKGRYVIIKKDCAATANYVTEPCTQTEGGTDNLRVYFSSPFELEALSGYIFDAYSSCHKSMEDYASHSSYARKETDAMLRSMRALSDDEALAMLRSAKERKYEPMSVSLASEPQISRSDVIINANHSRVPLSEIKNLNDWSKGYDKGHPFWEKGEEARKAGQYSEAESLYDKARYNGYDAPVLYDSYAILYRQLKDYSNEIVILDEGISRIPQNASFWEARRDKAIKLLYTQQENEKKAAEKEKLKAEKAAKKEAEASEPKQPRGRAILQMDDDGNIIKEFTTVSAAEREIGVSSKSIRDAATGVQKHAGGYCWAYKE